MSVKVPPISMAIAAVGRASVMGLRRSRHGIAVVAAMEELGGKAATAKCLGLGVLDGAAVVAERHAVLFSRGLEGNESAQHVPLHALGLAVEGVAEAAAAASLDPQDVAASHARTLADRRRRSLAGAAGIEHDAALAAVLATGDAPGRRHGACEAARGDRSRRASPRGPTP